MTPPLQGADEFLAAVAGARGKLRKGGVPDMRAAARIVLQDWNDGRIPYYTLPPSRGNTEFQDAAIVTNWSKEFNADEVFAQVSQQCLGLFTAHMIQVCRMPPPFCQGASKPCAQQYRSCACAYALQERSAVIAHLPAIDGPNAPAFFDIESAGKAFGRSVGIFGIWLLSPRHLLNKHKLIQMGWCVCVRLAHCAFCSMPPA
jgi:hypothetical protein